MQNVQFWKQEPSYFSLQLQFSETSRIRFRGVRLQTPNSVSLSGLTEFRGGELSEFLSAYYLCAKAKSPSFSQNSPSLPQNSVSSLFRNSTLETVFRPFPKFPFEAKCRVTGNSSPQGFSRVLRKYSYRNDLFSHVECNDAESAHLRSLTKVEMFWRSSCS